MKKYIAIARWEYLEKVKTKSFLLSLILFPLIITVMNLLPTFLIDKSEEKTQTYLFIDKTGEIGTEFKDSLESKYTLKNKAKMYNIILENYNDNDTALQKSIINRRISENDIDGCIYLYKKSNNDLQIEFYFENIGSTENPSRFNNIVRDIMFSKNLYKAGIPFKVINKLNPEIEFKTYRVNESGETKETDFLSTFFTSYIFIILFMMLSLSTGQMLVRSVVEEKSNKLIEVLLSSCTSKDLLAGKILGLSALGLTSISVWIIFGTIASALFSSFTFAVGFISLVLILFYFIVGYLLFSSIFVSVGSTCTTEQEAQQITSYISLLMVLPFVFIVPIMQNPDQQIVKILSFIPLFTPTFMMMRISITMPQTWEIILSLFILIITTYSFIVIGSKIFRIGILITGKKPKIKEIINWIKLKE